ncbi:hypothetical protein WC7_01712 [Citrobacter sp. KTE151]|nr:hypothetical protein WC7_01712 [Citrobacter sp. KTE151]
MPLINIFIKYFQKVLLASTPPSHGAGRREIELILLSY